MNNTNIILLVLILTIFCLVQCVQLFRAMAKIKRYKERITTLTNVQNRLHDIHHLKEFSWLFGPFYDYVRLGGRRIEDVREEIRFNSEERRQAIIRNYISTTSLMKIQKEQITVKRN